MKHVINAVAILGLSLALGCSEEQTQSLKNDADQAGSAASDALKTAGDATRDDVHQAAESVADDTSSN
jgi:hypothetical protein